MRKIFFLPCFGRFCVYADGTGQSSLWGTTVLHTGRLVPFTNRFSRSITNASWPYLTRAPRTYVIIQGASNRATRHVVTETVMKLERRRNRLYGKWRGPYNNPISPTFIDSRKRENDVCRKHCYSTLLTFFLHKWLKNFGVSRRYM